MTNEEEVMVVEVMVVEVMVVEVMVVEVMEEVNCCSWSNRRPRNCSHYTDNLNQSSSNNNSAIHKHHNNIEMSCSHIWYCTQ